jgi:hypothetical protein
MMNSVFGYVHSIIAVAHYCRSQYIVYIAFDQIYAYFVFIFNR